MNTVPVWLQDDLIRAAFLAGVMHGAGGTIGEVERSVHIALGETAAMPSIRDAFRNNPISGRHYADVGAWQESLSHYEAGMPKVEPARRDRKSVV